MATKRNLSDLVRQEFQSTKLSLQTIEVTDSGTVLTSNAVIPPVLLAESLYVAHPNEQTPKLTEFVSTELSESEINRVPKHKTLDRKEARLRPDQVEGLTKLTKALNRKRRGEGERITDNTLIRIAVDLLLKRADEVSGKTEAEIQQNFGLSVALEHK
ncbi:hypothetical protein [Oculatella sp. FACHB-28]|uniref:hypothetical protein n=1 Tax=Oculatella sp. FACHB-28 TaxID=2692845 RepID=UPI0018EFC656|nr:hypothetical protein [Oculatella sp. FACHB-28]